MLPEPPKTIAVIGGGFGGLRVAIELQKTFARNVQLRKKWRLVLVDRENYHLFTPELYEIASTCREDARAEALKRAVTVPFETITAHYPHITFIQDTAVGLDPAKKLVFLADSGELAFEYAVIAVGSVAHYYNIPGLESSSVALKNVQSAVRLRNAVRTAFERPSNGNPFRVVIGGGGPTGVELAGEIHGYLDKLARERRDSRSREITIIQGNTTILPPFSPEVIALAKKRLLKLGIRIIENERIASVRNGTVETERGGLFPYNSLLWAGGIQPAPFTAKVPFKKDARGRLLVTDRFETMDEQGKTQKHVFAIGDNSALAQQTPLPATAWSAISQGEHVARIMCDLLDECSPRPYRRLSERYILPIGGKYAIGQFGNTVLSGPHVWILKNFVYLRYLFDILPFHRAIRKWIRAFWIFLQND